jgi:hypothetical protein
VRAIVRGRASAVAFLLAVRALAIAVATGPPVLAFHIAAAAVFGVARRIDARSVALQQLAAIRPADIQRADFERPAGVVASTAVGRIRRDIHAFGSAKHLLPRTRARPVDAMFGGGASRAARAAIRLVALQIDALTSTLDQRAAAIPGGRSPVAAPDRSALRNRAAVAWPAATWPVDVVSFVSARHRAASAQSDDQGAGQACHRPLPRWGPRQAKE